MSSSILNDVKHMLGLLPTETAFDGDILIHINSVMSTLAQLGVGPVVGFTVMNATTQWDEFVTDARLHPVKSYMFLRVKLLFDPPQTGFAIQSMDRQIQELEWRLNSVADYELPNAQ
jgi:hypothetical protein